MIGSQKLFWRVIVLTLAMLACKGLTSEGAAPSTAIDPVRQAAWEAAQAQAKGRIDEFAAAVKAGKPESIRRAALNLQSDPIAVQKMNQSRPDLVDAHNTVTDRIKSNTRQNIKENMAKAWNEANPNKPPISAKDVKVYEPTNWKDPTAKPKSGQDWDVTVQIKQPDGTFKDVPPTQSQKVVEKSYFDAAGGEKTFGKGTTPEQAAHRQAVETTHGKSPEAYNEPKKILGEGGVNPQKPEYGKNLKDPEQLTHAVDNKSNQSANKAADARKTGTPEGQVEAVRQDFEEMRQASKQYDKIAKPRVEAQGGQVSSHVDKGMDIIRDAGDGKISPEEARAKLAEMGETPESIRNKAAGQAEAAQKLKPLAEVPDAKKSGPLDAPESKGPMDPNTKAGGPVDAPDSKGPMETKVKTGGPVDAPGSKGPIEPNAKTGGPVDAPDSKGPMETTGKTGVPADAPDTKVAGEPKGGKTGGSVDGPEGGKPPVADGPDGAGPGKFGKAMDKLGKGMQIVDIMSNAEDAKKAIQDGDMKKLREAGVNTVDGFTGGAIGTSRMLNDRLNTARGEKNEAQDEARRNAAMENDQNIRVELRKNGGYTKEQVDSIMSARDKGDDGPLKEGYEKIGKEIPKPKDTDPTWGQSAKNYGNEVIENTAEVATGIKDKTVKAGTFVAGTVKDVTEIGVGMTEKGVAGELIDQQKKNMTSENIKDGVEHIGDKMKELVGVKPTDADRESGAAKELADKLIARGADPAEAQKVANDLITHGGGVEASTALRDLMDKVKDKEKGGLKGNEATSMGQTEAPDSKTGSSGGGLEGLVGDKTSKSDSKKQSSYEGMKSQSDLSKATTSGDQQVRDAKNQKDKGGRDSQQTKDDSAKQTANADKKDSMTSTLADALAKGVADGGAAAGAAAGTATGSKAMGDIFKGAGATAGAGTGDKQADGADKDKVSTPSTSSGSSKPSPGTKEKPSSSRGSDEGAGAPRDSYPRSPSSASEVSSIYDEKRSPTVSKPKPPKKKSKTCNECGYSMTIPVEKDFPSRCPHCGAGPGLVMVSCSKCSYVYKGPPEGAPKFCPRCPKVSTPPKKR